jgi:hypothetical protein
MTDTDERLEQLKELHEREIVNSLRTQALEASYRRKALLISYQHAGPQEYIELADIALANGDCQAARMSLGLVALERGASPDALSWRADEGARTGLWHVKAFSRQHDRTTFSVDAAVNELRILLAIDETTSAGPPLPPSETPTASAFAAYYDRIDAEIKLLMEAGDQESVAAFHQAIAPQTEQWPFFDLSRHVAEKPGALARMNVFNRLKLFMLQTREITLPPFGSPALLEAASRLATGALGPYFCNVKHLIRNERDISAMIHLAADKSADVDTDRWIVLLSGHLSPSQSRDLASWAARLSKIKVLDFLIDRAKRKEIVDTDAGLLWRIRDECLKHGLVDQACRAQRLVASWGRPFEIVEWSILGDMLGAVGQRLEAELAFSRCLSISSRDKHARDALAALEGGRFEAFCRLDGFFAIPERLEMLDVITAQRGYPAD